MKNIKVMFKAMDTQSNHEGLGDNCILLLDDKVVVHDNMFDTHLGECDMSIEDFLSTSPSEIVNDLLSALVDTYYYEKDDTISLMWDILDTLDISTYTLVKEFEMEDTELKLLVEDVFSSVDYLVATDIILGKFKLN